MNGGGAAAAVGAAAAIANAIKASGVIVRVEPRDSQKIVERCEAPLVVIAPGGFFRTRHNDLSLIHRGLFFFTRSKQPLPGRCKVVKADKIWIPG